MELYEIEERIGYTFSDKQLLQKALTLSSYDGQFNNQSLECLGDALLGFIIAEKYYWQGYAEGEITNMKKLLLSDSELTPISIKLGLDQALIKGKGDDNNKKAIPSAFEAMVAAIYIDGGLDNAKQFVISSLDFSPKSHEVDYISELQELLQSRGQMPPKYEKEELGTPQKPYFKAFIEVEGKTYFGESGSFTQAKKLAAKTAFENIKNKLQ
jgi:ribonuclease-3